MPARGKGSAQAPALPSRSKMALPEAIRGHEEIQNQNQNPRFSLGSPPVKKLGWERSVKSVAKIRPGLLSPRPDLIPRNKSKPMATLPTDSKPKQGQPCPC